MSAMRRFIEILRIIKRYGCFCVTIFGNVLIGIIKI